MRTRNLIDIPNHPTLVGVTRAAQVRRCDNHYEAGIAEMTLNIFCYSDGTEVKDLFKQVSLTATDAKINPETFEYAVADEEGNYPEGSVSEYDHLFDILENGVKTQFELEEMFILLRIDTINEKIYN